MLCILPFATTEHSSRITSPFQTTKLLLKDAGDQQRQEILKHSKVAKIIYIFVLLYFIRRTHCHRQITAVVE